MPLILVLFAALGAAPQRCHHARAVEAQVSGDVVTVCFGEQVPQCFQRDLRTERWTRAPAKFPERPCTRDEFFPDAGVTVSAVFTRCEADGGACQSVELPRRTPCEAGLLAATSADRTRLAVEGEELRATLIDVATGKRVATSAPWPTHETRGAWRLTTLRFVGEALLMVRLNGDTSEARLIDASGAVIAELGDGAPLAVNAPVVTRERIALLTADLSSLVVHDASGHFLNRLTLYPGRHEGVVGALESSQDGRSVIAVRMLDDGDVVRADLETLKLEVLAGPFCP